ncbi:MAG: SDR family oxidoreductase [Gammaproteobacteria bacterium]|nr:SDR family oxidoreductase [Gammaproteobacteria bacterium]
MSQNVVITGANRGIGLSLSKLLSERGDTVFALCRQASSALNELNVRVIEGVDVSSPEVGEKLKIGLGSEQIDLLVNNAGILRNEVLGDIDYATVEQQFTVNALGPLRVTEALEPQLVDGSKVAMITSRMGSIADNTSGGRYGYRMSKAALNIAAVSLAHDLASRQISVGVFHPGLVGTEMIGGFGDITPDQAAVRLATRITELNLQNSGSFWHSNGEILPW